MNRCDRCGHWHHAKDTSLCEACWKELGQMELDFDDDDEYMPTIDGVFDRMAERENRFP